jgi:hypothetical protein
MESLNTSLIIVKFSKFTNVIGLSVILIILFILTPLNTFILSSMFGKIIIIALLGYTLYYNTQKTNKFVNHFNVNIWNENENWNLLQTNVLCGYVFSIFLLTLIISVLRHFF